MAIHNYHLNTEINQNVIITSSSPQLPSEIILQIFKNLQEFQDRFNSIAVCKQWNQSLKTIDKDQWILDANHAKGVFSLQTFHDCHGNDVTSLVLSSDRKKLFSGSVDKTIKIWNVETKKCLQTLHGHSDRVNALALSANGKKLFSGSNDKTIKIWDVETKKCLHTLDDYSGYTNSIALSADGNKLFSISRDNTIKIWDVETGTCLQTLHTQCVWLNSITLSPDGKKLFAGDNNAMIEILDVETGDCLYTLEGNWNELLALSADGKKLFSGSSNGKIKIWDLETRDYSHTLEDHSARVHAFAVSPNGKKLFSGSGDGKIKVWDVETRDCLYTLHFDKPLVQSLALSSDRKKLFSGFNDGKIKIWNYGASSAKVFKELAKLFQENSSQSTQQALERFERMPQKAKQAIYQELCLICKALENDCCNWSDAFHNKNNQSSTPIQKAQAIINYLQKQKVLTVNLSVHNIIAGLGIVTEEDYSEKLKNTPSYLAKIGLKTVEDLKALGLGFEPIDKLIVNNEELTDRLELQTQAYNNKEALLSFVETLLKVVDQKIKEIPTAAFHIAEEPWMDLQKNLKAFKANLDNIESQDFNSLKENFSPKKCAAMAETANALAEATEAAEKKYQIEKLGAYVNQWGIHKLWTRLRQEGIKNLSAFLQQSKESQDLFRMGE